MISQLHDATAFHFGSDNYAGVHPEVLEALATANGGHVLAYGDDPYTERFREVVREQFGERAEAYPVFNGTGANVVALQAMLPRWGTVQCTSAAHINTDEQGAPERIGGIKLLPVASASGKLTPELLIAPDPDDVHRASPQVVSASNSTELGTVYSPEEFSRLADAAHAAGMFVHLDGSRIANAAAAQGGSLAELAAGADVISLGATKNGALAAEAVIVVNPDAVRGTDYLRKITTQLASKQRFVSAQLLALYEGDLWRRNAEHANAKARELGARLAELPGVEVPLEVEANAVFPVLPEGVADRARERSGLRFYDWPPMPGAVRLMASWDTPDESVDALVDAIRAAL
ncbi:beta-eliminating lyase-related protein [Gulosibacter faecalis]|uniref:Threonine aldolase family protein n=1 Tax=Gulosibacter faecalis TaxID=272240 RepID=A0ABW5UT45_9MICO